MRVLITGSDGFVAHHLRRALAEQSQYELMLTNRRTTHAQLRQAADHADIVVHLAGVSHPAKPEDLSINVQLTTELCYCLRHRRVPILFASSRRVHDHNDYGDSKLAAEHVIRSYCDSVDVGALLLRWPNLFGYTDQPGRGGVVAAFCRAAVRGQSLPVTQPNAIVYLMPVHDAVAELLQALRHHPSFCTVREYPVHPTTVGELALWVRRFADTPPEPGPTLAWQLYEIYRAYRDEKSP